MKMLKRWLAFFVVIVLLIGVAFNSRGPLIASQVDGTTEGTADPSAASAEGEQQVPEGQDQQSQEIEGTEGTIPEEPQASEGQEQVQEPQEQAQPTPEQEEPKTDEKQPEEKKEEEKPEVHQDAMELKQQMTDENGTVICTVTANIPEGTFEANTSDVTMEVGYVAADTTEQIKALMEKSIADDKMLGEYFMYDVKFKVNGEQVEPGKEIQITFEPNSFQVKDTKKAVIFYYNEANSPAGNTEAELVGITQRADKIQELQNAGQSIDTVDDYDLSEISLREDGSAEKVMMEGRRSTVYGCYLVEEKPVEPDEKESVESKEENIQPETLNYEDDDVIITVSADKIGVFPENATLQVLPIKKDESQTEEQYKEVEEQLNKRAENEDYDIAGFLAYDISFINDKGEEVEPNGNVKVTIDYKNEVLPEDVTTADEKNLDVTVMHLEEDEKGAVKEVVDMAEDESTEAAVETTDDTKVKKAEFVTDSFSYFTVTWKGYQTTKSIDIKFVDEAGYEINLSDDSKALDGITFTTSQEFKMSDITESGSQKKYYAITDKKGQSYTFKKAVNDWNWTEGNVSGTDISALRYKDNQIKWKKKGEFSYTDHDSRDAFYFMYGKVKASIKELPTESDNIKISLYNYNRDIKNPGINTLQNSGFGFYSGNGEKDGKSGYSGAFTNSGKQGIFQGIVKANLSNGTPVLNNTRGSSMGYLFGNGDNEAVTKYEGLSGLFQKDEDGYYYYDSLRNAAVLKGNQIKVYDGTVCGEDFTFGNFLPFNDEYLKTGTNHLNSIPRNITDMWFGMNVGMNFYQPRDGRINNQDMIFEFRGDDDVWVFIDGMLVLDIGGIHGKLDGSINFNSGQVVAAGKQTTLWESFYKAYEEQGLSKSQIYDKLDSIFNKRDGQFTSFKNYSSHKFEFFYLERGGGASNCKIKFNMPRIPEESVMITKEVVNDNDEMVDYSSDIDFQFSIKKNDQTLVNTNYLIYENSQQIGAGITDESGQFKLKHGQSAVFEGFKVTDNYEVKELGAYLDGYEVEFDNTILVKHKETEGTTTINSVTTGKLDVDEISSAVFKNKVTNTGNLYIKKTLSSGSSELVNKEFPIQVNIQGKPYSGSYSKDGKTYITKDGVIGIKKDQTVQITGLPYGTSFEILEQQDGSYLPTYTITGSAYDIVLPEYDNDGILVNGAFSASGKIAGDSTVEIKNSAVKIQTGTTSVDVTKTWKDFEKYDLPEYVEVTLYEDTNRNEQYDKDVDMLVPGMSPIRLTDKNDWKGTWINLPADVDYVVKESYPEGYKLFNTIITNSITEVKPVYTDGNIFKHSPNNGTMFNLGKNNILLVKETSNSYFLWTPYDLGLNQKDINSIVELMKPYLKGSGNLNEDNISYKFGAVNSGGNASGITLNETDKGWTLKFTDTSIWALFWNFSYNRVETIKLENTIDDNLKTQVSVNKVWQGDNESTRPNHITVQLYKNGEPEGESVNITRDKKWKYTFTDLDYYSYDSEKGKYIKNEYSVKEIEIGNETVDVNGQANGYQSNINKNDDGSFTITNAMEWQIAKVSNKSNDIKLPDAVFKLWTGDMSGDNIQPIYGKSDNVGIVKWYQDSMCQRPMEGSIPDGTYKLTEEQAPIGYAKSGEVWSITIYNGGVTEITSTNGEVFKNQIEGKWTFYFKNSAVYNLPESGGSGIFWYAADVFGRSVGSI